MAQKLREGESKSGIARAGKRKWGYDPAQVDGFLERAHALYDSEGAKLTQRDIQDVSFDVAKNGYVISQVDAALSRLERAVVDKQTTWEISQHGRVTWKAQTEKLYQEIAKHAERAERERFRSGNAKQPSYDKKQVDRLIDQIVDKAAASLGVDGVNPEDVRKLADLNANAVNNVVFTQRKGKKGYDERQVDYFLNTCVQLLSRLESYARVADFVGDSSASATAAEAASPAPAADVSSLFASAAPQAPASEPAVQAQPQMAASPVYHESFDALHQAERDLFTAPAAQEKPVSYAPAFSASAPSGPSAPQPVSYAPSVKPEHQHVEPVTPTPAAAPTVAQSETVQSETVVLSPIPDDPFGTKAAAGQTTAQAQPDSHAAVSAVPTPSDHTAPAQAAAQPAPEPPAAPSFKPLHTRDAAVQHAPEAAEPVIDTARDDSSLAALAHMVEISQEMPAIRTQAFEPKMPSLDTPSVLKLNNMPEPVMPSSVGHAGTGETQTDGSDAQPNEHRSAQQPAVPASASTQHRTDDLFPSFFPLENGFDTDIPDLSFPTLNDPEPKKEQ